MTLSSRKQAEQAELNKVNKFMERVQKCTRFFAPMCIKFNRKICENSCFINVDKTVK